MNETNRSGNLCKYSSSFTRQIVSKVPSPFFSLFISRAQLLDDYDEVKFDWNSTFSVQMHVDLCSLEDLSLQDSFCVSFILSNYLKKETQRKHETPERWDRTVFKIFKCQCPFQSSLNNPNKKIILYKEWRWRKEKL